MKVRVSPGTPKGMVVVPPSKSMAHRAILAAALSDGESRISNVAASEDIEATLSAVARLGARVEQRDDEVIIYGVRDLSSFSGGEVFCNESGSTLRFLIPVFSLTGKEVTFTGKGRLLSRPKRCMRSFF
jgi:3-phosphoshikimate 1-carboxyvinyltransferase